MSCLAALQAAVVMMSQNRPDEKGQVRRQEGLSDKFKIRNRNPTDLSKTDHLGRHQQEELIEIEMTINILSKINKEDRFLNARLD